MATESAEKNNRKPEFDMLKGLGIILMILGHIGLPASFDHYIHAFHMPLFFIISGYFFIADRTPKQFWKKMWNRLIVPYICVLFFELLYKSILREPLPIQKILTNSLPICGTMWFIIALLIIEVISYYSVHYGGDILFAFLSFWAVLLGMYLINLKDLDFFVFLKKHKQYFAFQPAMSSLGFFFIGYILRKMQAKYPRYVNWPFYISLIVLGISAFTVHLNGPVNLRTGKYGNPLLFYLNGTLITWALLNLFRNLSSVLKSRKLPLAIFSYIGINSLCYMVTNQFVIKFILPLLWPQKVIEPLPILLKLILTCLIITFINMIAKRIGAGWVFGLKPHIPSAAMSSSNRS